PQGRSLLRSLYRPWYFKKNMEAIEAIGVERDVGGAPIVSLGEGVYTDNDITRIREGLEGLRMDETLYMIMPNGTEIEAYGGGSKSYNVREIIRDWQHLIRQRFFADFLSLGSEQVGTQALAKEMNTFFSLALGAIQTRMMETWNDQLIPWLFEWNHWQPESGLPNLVWSKVGQRNLQSIAQAYNSLVGSGLLTPDDSIEEQIRAEAGLPPLTPEMLEVKRALRDKEIREALAPTPAGPEGGQAPGPTGQEQLSEFESSLVQRVIDRIRGRTPVVSSNVRSIKYDQSKRELEVVFLPSSSFVYLDVPLEIYEGLRDSPSKGKYVWEVLRNRGKDDKYAFRRK
ncbi:hypothetical protein LCGC14_2993550, partial [marine sediment metagenome]